MWLLDDKTRVKLDKIFSSLEYKTYSSDEALSKYNASENRADFSSGVTIDGTTAIIDVSGVLTKEPDFFMRLFGIQNVTYSEIKEDINTTVADDNISDITFNIDSPGGEVAGLFDIMDAIADIEKPTRAVVSGLAASAAYGIASATDTIAAVSPYAEFGSIGVLTSFYSDDTRVNITSSKAPKKGPDPKTKDGLAIIQSDLDDLHDRFVSLIARGRNLSSDAINENFGKGATFFADKALQNRMIDSIVDKDSFSLTSSSTVVDSLKETNKPILETNAMSDTNISDIDLDVIKSQHPTVYNAIKAEGVAAERTRVLAHLRAAKASNAYDVAIDAVDKGDDFSAEKTLQYIAAAKKSDVVSDRLKDDVGVSALDVSTEPANDKQAFYGRVMSLAKKQLRVK